MKEFNFEDEQFAELDYFLEKYSEAQDEYYSQARLWIINPKRYGQFKDALRNIAKFIKITIPDANIKYELYDVKSIPVKTDTSIIIETKKIFINDLKKFVDIIKLSTNISIIPLINDNVRIYIHFNKIIEQVIQNDK